MLVLALCLFFVKTLLVIWVRVPPIFSDDVYDQSVCLYVPVCVCVHLRVSGSACVQSVAAISWVPSVTPDVTNIPANVAANATSPVDSATNAWQVLLLTYLLNFPAVGSVIVRASGL